MLWNLTALWSFSSTVWHLFKVQTELFAFQIPSPLPFRTTSPLFPVSLIHFPPSAQEGHQRDATARQPSSPRRPCPELVGPPLSPETPSCAPLPRSRGALLKGEWGGGEVPAAEEADCWLTPALLSRKPRRLSISRRLWQGPGARSNPCVRADEPHYPMKYFIITTAVKYWWLLASAECFSRRLSLRVMEPNSSLYTVSDIWKLPKKSKGA